MKVTEQRWPDVAHVVTGPTVANVACRHCGSTLTLPMPLSMDVYLLATRQFLHDHATCPPPPMLTEDERDLLFELDAYERNMADLGMAWKWARPLDVGGHSGSNHSYLLSKLARLGYAEVRQRSPLTGRRGSKEYRVSERGRQLLKDYVDSRRGGATVNTGD